VAVIWAVPEAAAETSPVEDTVATAVLLLANVTVRPVSVLPLASFNKTTACVDWPTVRLVLFSVTVTVATGAGAFTVTVAELVIPSLVALIAAVPAATAVTKPVLDTVATPVLLLAKVIVLPVRMFPPASLSVTTAWVV
jgi:hypothetical protein